MKTLRGLRIKKSESCKLHCHAAGPSYMVDRATGRVLWFQEFRPFITDGEKKPNIKRSEVARYLREITIPARRAFYRMKKAEGAVRLG